MCQLKCFRLFLGFLSSFCHHHNQVEEDIDLPHSFSRRIVLISRRITYIRYLSTVIYFSVRYLFT